MAEHASAHSEAEVAEPAAAAPAAAPVAAPTPQFVRALQRSAGNRAVGRFLGRAPTQVTLPADEPLEAQEIVGLGQAMASYHRVRNHPNAVADTRTADEKRDAIVSLALSQVGKVDSSGFKPDDAGRTPLQTGSWPVDTTKRRTDGRKWGAERLLWYYRTAAADYTSSLDEGILGANLFAGQTRAAYNQLQKEIAKGEKPKDAKLPKGGPWSWCAIFGVWAIKTVTGIGTFGGQPYGLGPVINLRGTPLENALAVKKGDMICRNDKWTIEKREKKPTEQSLNHQCLVADVDLSDEKDPQVLTINGNGDRQQIWLRKETIKNYWGYYDSLSQTDFGKYEAEVRKRPGKAIEQRKREGLDEIQ